METYVINYNDGRAMTLELTIEQYGIICTGFQANFSGVIIPDIGCLKLTDVRSIIKQNPVVEDNPSYSSELTQAEIDYVKNQQQWDDYLKGLEKEERNDESDFDGSDI